MSADPLLVLDGISKSFGRVVVADDLAISVEEGGALGIVGPNGAGKSSLFNMISGDLRPDRGRVVLAGADVTKAGAAQRTRLGIGRTYQIPRPFEHMTVFENVLVSAQQGARLGSRESYDRGAAILERCDLSSVANLPAGRLTLLQRKRLELARAWATGPRVLLLDEVAGGLTGPEVAELVALVRDARSDGITVVWIEHVVHALVATVPRLICLAGGRVVADGEPRAVLANREVMELYLGTGADSDLGAAG